MVSDLYLISWGEPFFFPMAVRLKGIYYAIMKSVGPTLPELDTFGNDGIPAPVSRTLHFFSNPTSYLSNESSYKLHTAADGLTLWGYTSSDPAFIRAFFEILIRFIRGDFFSRTFDMYLPF